MVTERLVKNDQSNGMVHYPGMQRTARLAIRLLGITD